jgi:hypothetical protein
MKEKDFYHGVLGITEPWEITKVDLNVIKEEVHVYLEYRGAAGICPKCGKATSIHDKREERVWRH